MARERTWFALAVVLAVVVVGTAAAGLDGQGTGAAGGPASSAGAGVGGNTGAGMGNGSGAGIQFANGTTAGTGLLPPAMIKIGMAVVFGGSLLLGAALLAVALVREGVRGFLRRLKVALADALRTAALFLGLALVLLALSALAGDGGGGAGGHALGQGLFGSDGGAAPAVVPNVPVPLLAALGLLAVAGLAAVSERLAGGSDSATVTPIATGSLAGRRAVSSGASGVRRPVRAFEDVPAENDVYRAWRDLARAVEGADRAVDTPAEIARTATAEGLDERGVRALTEAFTEVRYGDEAADPERERRARDALERASPDDGESADESP